MSVRKRSFDFMLEIFNSLNNLSWNYLTMDFLDQFLCRMPQWTFHTTHTCVTAASHCTGGFSAVWQHSTSHWTEASLCIPPLVLTTHGPAGMTLWWTASLFWTEGCSVSWELPKKTINWTSLWLVVYTSREGESSGPTMFTFRVSG